MKRVIRLCERLAPLSCAMDGDNCGVIIGSATGRCSGVAVALDLTEEAILVASAAGANMIIVHHPPIYHPIRRIDAATGQGRAIAAALRARMTVYAMHTNLDFSPKGLNDHVARLVGLGRVKPAAGPAKAVYRIGVLPRPMTAAAFARQVKLRLQLPAVRLFGEGGRGIRRVAVCTGSGADLLADAMGKGADLLLTGEVRHHHAMECGAAGALIIDAGHWGTERPMVDLVSGYLKKMMAKTGKGTTIIPLHLKQPFTDH